ncbi:ribonuclease P protein component [Mesoplasma entomophilum]|uniref:Ribonuclease P protein component n=1 Tax=Mesoplasma entomophilum TaxID=2149 RepID=A0A3S5Y0I7_9MOLU|nr:ribonuclease P protein component [Mesoplasma entomophilum]ATQ35852.1 ribonuclease P protein component [Mesoplasma entomophilum]ATZ19824.1 ribonuclease P (protein C5) [Mesoplasma entomophilum]AVN60669.1 ribonuclease P protein component [Mesoplasma entomophilum]
MKNKKIIKKNFEFQEIISKQEFYRNSSFVIYYSKNDKGYFRYGISVGKKLGNAVTRNKIKRQIRMMIQDQIKTSPEFSYDIIVIARNRLMQNSFDQNQRELRKLIVRFFK